eukprot:gnl/TRDRNA2_/TRDRNA2_183338_c0_seq1.p1 gnl/TRDRNA2_/TRDRNA2_183338_c0~~gnl/TRDRNA2_/TRDRNA2_183338_c0_seq1.p1  ORF type:complete len:422 (+),score=42.17 gnl/TRDRNA2_/TRDRNA2_183338_c0_seq1:79-1344(+)
MLHWFAQIISISVLLDLVPTSFSVRINPRHRDSLQQSGADAMTFAEYVKKFNKTYGNSTADYRARQAIFERRTASIRQHNDRPDRLWTAAINHLTDWTDSELKSLRGWRGSGTASSRRTAEGQFTERQYPMASILPMATSYTHLRSLGDIQNQWACGSCWAVATGTMLNAHAEIYGAQRTFSIETILQCAPNPNHCGGEGGCEGSTVELGMNYVMHAAVPTAEAQPLRGPFQRVMHNMQGRFGMVDDCSTIRRAAELMENAKLLRSTNSQGFHPEGFYGQPYGLYGWERLPVNQYEPLLRALVEKGPVGISLSAHNLMTYGGGIFDGCKRDAVVDHAVVLIGYGAAERMFYQIQNSWGSWWGEGGRFRLLRRDDEQTWCGIDSQPELGSGCKGDPARVTVCGTCGILYDSVVPYFRRAQAR